MLGPDDFEMQIQQEEIPGIQPELSIPPAQDEQYGDFIVRQGQNMGEIMRTDQIRNFSRSMRHLEFYMFR